MTTKLFQDLSARDKASIPSVVESLRHIHEGRAPNPLAPVLKAADRPAAVETPLFGAIRSGFEAMQRQSRRHAEFVDRLVSQSSPPRAPVAAPYQETLYLQGACGGRTGGRLRCVNRRAQRVEVAALLRPFALDGEPAPQAPALTLRPGGFFLEAGEARIVVVDADLAGCEQPGRLESSVDFLMNDAVTLKLWIEIDVYV